MIGPGEVILGSGTGGVVRRGEGGTVGGGRRGGRINRKLSQGEYV